MTRGLFAILSCMVLLVAIDRAEAQTVNLSLNLQYTNPANPALGGAWTLVAKTNSASGIAAISAILANINAAGITAQAGIGSVLDGGSPFVITNGSTVEVLYFQDLSIPASVVTNVGRGAGTPGNLPVDPLNDPLWNNSARIFSGTFGASTPAFTTNNDVIPNATDANVLATGAPPYSTTAAASLTTIVRDNLGNILGDYNLNGTVDAADYTVWRNTLGAAGAGLAADGSGNNLIDQADYGVWRSRFGANSGSGAALGTGTDTAVPEPGAWTFITALMAFAGLLFSRRIVFHASIALTGVYSAVRSSRGVVRRLTGIVWTILASAEFVADCAAILSEKLAKRLLRCSLGLILAVVLTGGTPVFAQVSWDNGAGTFLWGDFNNWNPNGNPTGDPVSIGNLVAAANDTTLVDAVYVISSLTITAGADVINSHNGGTTDFELEVTGATSISGVGSSIIVYGGNPDGLDTGTLTINNGGDLILNSQEAVGTAVVEVDSGALTNNVGGLVVGNGRIDLEQSVGAGTVLFNNEGTLTAGYVGAIFGTPPATTLQITALDADALVDLDGIAAGGGIVNVNRNATLDLNVPISDAFGGDLNLAAGATLDIAAAWSINAGTVDVNTPGILAGTGGPAAHLAGGTITISGGALTLNDDLDGLVIDAALTATGGAINNSGTITFNAASTIGAVANFNMNGVDSKLIVNSVVNIDDPDFNLDGADGANNVTTINAGGNLDLDLGAGADENFSHVININGGELDVTTADNTWSLNSDGVINAGGAATSSINGETFSLAGTGSVNVAAGATLNVNATTQITGATDVTIAAGATLNFAVVTYGNAGASFTGEGLLRKGTATISAPTTWDVAVVDLDDGSTTLNEDLTISTTAIEDSPADGFDSTVTINDTFLLTVQIAGTNTWTLDPAGVIAYNGNATADSYLAGSDVVLNGTINHNGDGRIDARLDIGATGIVNINTVGEPLHLSGGDGTINLNTIAGGVVNGPGVLAADTETALRGFGTINANIDFSNSASLYADNGTLTFNGAILDANLIVAFNDGVINVTDPWNTNVVGAISLFGGELAGATVTNDGGLGIGGNGLVSAQVINSSRLRGHSGGTLILQTAANDNDWDGGGAGRIVADGADVELRDVGAAFGFTGDVEVMAGRRVFANGFALDFNPGSTLSLTGGTYESTSSTDLGGTVTVGAGGGTIAVANNNFLTFETGSSTTLNANLTLENNNINIEAGAMFSGAGAIVVPDGSNIVADNLADIGVLLDMQGGFRPGNSGGIGRVELLDYQQGNTGDLFVELTGTSLNAFDRLVLSGDAVLDGYLNIDIDPVSPGVPFVPTLGQTFNIITANSVTGAFDFADVSGMPEGLTLHIEYLSNAVQLQVVNTPFFSADFDDDGDVDATDLSIWKGAFDLNQLGDADGDNDSDGADLLIWQRQFGSHPGAAAGNLTDAAVPEPASQILILLVAVATCFRIVGGRVLAVTQRSGKSHAPLNYGRIRRYDS
ncbi:MAG: hypothetical protein WD851_17120 [Pirellulales bacterium]